MSRVQIDKKRKELFELELQRRKAIRVLLSRVDLIEGSYSEVMVRCGRTGCHCEKKPAHPVGKLGYRENGIIKNKVVRVADRDRVSALVQTYRAHRQALKVIARIEEKEHALYKALIQTKGQRYQ